MILNLGLSKCLPSVIWLLPTLAAISCATPTAKSPVDFADVRYFHIFKQPDKAPNADAIEELVVLAKAPKHNSDGKLSTRNYFEAKNTNPLFRFLIKNDMEKNTPKTRQ
jgi:hypothetical protein